MANQSLEIPRRNWPLIWAGVVVGLVVAATLIGSIALFVTNFNLLDWIE